MSQRESENVIAERARRLRLWSELEAHLEVAPPVLRELGIHRGQQGIFRDSHRTREIEAEGVAVSVLHTGRVYDDELGDDGLVYHYPVTGRGRRDFNEVASLRHALKLGLPVFVVTPDPQSTALRQVHLGWVVEDDPNLGAFLLEFHGNEPAAIPSPDERPFPPVDYVRFREVTTMARMGQSRFRFEVLSRYGGRCVLSGLGVRELLDAAHLQPVSEGGSNDPRNALLLSATLHRAFGRGFFVIDPDELTVLMRPGGPSRRDLGIVEASLRHLESPPHREALRWARDSVVRSGKWR